jgi:hypothetical protein
MLNEVGRENLLYRPGLYREITYVGYHIDAQQLTHINIDIALERDMTAPEIDTQASPLRTGKLLFGNDFPLGAGSNKITSGIWFVFELEQNLLTDELDALP